MILSVDRASADDRKRYLSVVVEPQVVTLPLPPLRTPKERLAFEARLIDSTLSVSIENRGHIDLQFDPRSAIAIASATCKGKRVLPHHSPHWLTEGDEPPVVIPAGKTVSVKQSLFDTPLRNLDSREGRCRFRYALQLDRHTTLLSNEVSVAFEAPARDKAAGGQ